MLLKAAILVKISYFIEGVCHSLKRVGGWWWRERQAVDGDKFVCMDTFTPEDCLVYSFGIADDWDFEDFMDSLGCYVWAYDLFWTYPSTR